MEATDGDSWGAREARGVRGADDVATRPPERPALSR